VAKPLTIEALAAEVDAQTKAGSAIDRLAAAAVKAETLRTLGDELLDRYVQAARADGRSWTQIGEALGVTKQAAQQRFVTEPAVETTNWPEHFSDAARKVVAAAIGEARAMRHRYLGTEHLLLALTAADGLAGAALAHLDVGYDAVRRAIVEDIGLGHSGADDTLGITPRTKRAFESTLREAKRLGSRCAENEHLLIALSSSEGVAAQILRGRGAGPDEVRAALAQLLEGQAPEVAAKLRTPPRRGLRRSRR
jgi:hypothetical protein